MDSITTTQQTLIDQHLFGELSKQGQKHFKELLKAPEFAEAVGLQRDLQDYLSDAPRKSPLKPIFEAISKQHRNE